MYALSFMNVGTNDIKIGILKPFQDYVDDGWKEGFKVNWPDFPNDALYTNSLINKSNYGNANGSGQGQNGGNAVTADNTFSGWKFLYKPYNNTTIQWVLLYVVLNDLTQGADHYHYYMNNYYLQIDGKDMIVTPEKGNTQKTSNLGVTPQFGGIAQGYNKLGALPMFPQGRVAKGTTNCIFYGKFVPEGSESFNVKFTYVNTDYIANNNGWYIQCFAKTSSNWNTPKENWRSYASSATANNSAYSQFVDRTYMYSGDARLAPNAPITCKSGGAKVSNVSYGQNPVVIYSDSGGKYVKLSDLKSDTGWQAAGNTYATGKSYDLNNIRPKTGDSQPNPLVAYSSFWNTGSWHSSKDLAVRYSPHPSKVQKSIAWQGSDSVNIKFTKLTPIDTNGYFNRLIIRDGISGHSDYIVSRSFYSQNITINISRNTDTGIISVDGQETSLGGIDTFSLTFICSCYKDSTYYQGYSFDLSFSEIPQGPDFVIQDASIDFPNNSQDEAHIYEDQNGIALTDICLSITIYGQPLDPITNKFIIVYGDQVHQFINPNAVEHHGDHYEYRLKMKDVVLNSNADSLRIYTDVEDVEPAVLAFSPQIHPYVDYSSIQSGTVIYDEIITSLRRQMNYQWQNYFKYFQMIENSDYPNPISESLMNETIPNNSVVFGKILLDDLEQMIVPMYMSYKNSRKYNLDQTQHMGPAESPFNRTDVNRVAFGAVKGIESFEPDNTLFVYESDDVEAVTSKKSKLVDRLVAEVVKQGSKYVINYNTATGQKKALFISEEGIYDLIIADPNVFADGTLIILSNFQKAMLFMLGVYSKYIYRS